MDLAEIIARTTPLWVHMGWIVLISTRYKLGWEFSNPTYVYLLIFIRTTGAYLALNVEAFTSPVN